MRVCGARRFWGLFGFRLGVARDATQGVASDALGNPPACNNLVPSAGEGMMPDVVEHVERVHAGRMPPDVAWRCSWTPFCDSRPRFAQCDTLTTCSGVFWICDVTLSLNCPTKVCLRQPPSNQTSL